jgi:hypothetical protein
MLDNLWSSLPQQLQYAFLAGAFIAAFLGYKSVSNRKKDGGEEQSYPAPNNDGLALALMGMEQRLSQSINERCSRIDHNLADLERETNERHHRNESVLKNINTDVIAVRLTLKDAGDAVAGIARDVIILRRRKQNG